MTRPTLYLTMEAWGTETPVPKILFDIEQDAIDWVNRKEVEYMGKSYVFLYIPIVVGVPIDQEAEVNEA